MAIGLSAGGLEALRGLIASLPKNANYAYLIAQHISLGHEATISNALSGGSSHLSFVDITKRTEPTAQTVYMAPPNVCMVVSGGFLELLPSEQKSRSKSSADNLFASLAESVGAKAIGIVLSGNGCDGAQGVRAIRAHGGITIAQDPDTARFDSMPRAAIKVGSADLILNAKETGSFLAMHALDQTRLPDEEIVRACAFEQIGELVKARHGIDFSCYKQQGVCDQISRRMQTLRFASIDQYADLLRQFPAEVERLHQSLLKTLTSFFKDEHVWQALQRALADQIDTTPTEMPIRVWVAGCASGEEAYSVAILLNELLQQRSSKRQAKIFATDLDERSLEVARAGSYPAFYVEQQVSRPLRNRYFTRQERTYLVSKTLRDQVVFKRHNLIADRAIDSVDLICCRNVLVDLLPEMQVSLLKLFGKALQGYGLLFLGKSERTDDEGPFEMLSGETGIYRRVVKRV